MAFQKREYVFTSNELTQWMNLTAVTVIVMWFCRFCRSKEQALEYYAGALLGVAQLQKLSRLSRLGGIKMHKTTVRMCQRSTRFTATAWSQVVLIQRFVEELQKLLHLTFLKFRLFSSHCVKEMQRCFDAFFLTCKARLAFFSLANIPRLRHVRLTEVTWNPGGGDTVWHCVTLWNMLRHCKKQRMPSKPTDHGLALDADGSWSLFHSRTGEASFTPRCPWQALFGLWSDDSYDDMMIFYLMISLRSKGYFRAGRAALEFWPELTWPTQFEWPWLQRRICENQGWSSTQKLWNCFNKVLKKSLESWMLSFWT